MKEGIEDEEAVLIRKISNFKASINLYFHETFKFLILKENWCDFSIFCALFMLEFQSFSQYLILCCFRNKLFSFSKWRWCVYFKQWLVFKWAFRDHNKCNRNKNALSQFLKRKMPTIYRPYIRRIYIKTKVEKLLVRNYNCNYCNGFYRMNNEILIDTCILWSLHFWSLSLFLTYLLPCRHCILLMTSPKFLSWPQRGELQDIVTTASI